MEAKRENRPDVRHGTGRRTDRPKAWAGQAALKRNPRLRSKNSGQGSRRMEAEWEAEAALEMRRREIRHRRILAKRRRRRMRRMLLLGGMFGCFLAAWFFLLAKFLMAKQAKPAQEGQKVSLVENALSKPSAASREPLVQGLPSAVFDTHPDWTEDFLSVSEWARPGEALPEVLNIFVHYTANKNTSAAQNRNYFEGLKDSRQTAASAHFIIGYEGEIIQCIPLDEIGYAVKGRNYDSISIECCYQSEDGSFNKKTYDSLIALLKWLVKTYQLRAEDILRHYDSGGKKCPIYYTEHPDKWKQLKEDVAGKSL